MIRRASSLGLFLAAGLALAGCNQQELASTKHLQPIPSKTMALMEEKGMRKQDPILVRIYKEESKLEIWKKSSSGRYALLKDYEICRWSGTLGPKVREGDKQAPEGFYAVAPGQMNPKSNYYLSFNLGFPNAFDKSMGRSGNFLMVHGDCLSAGCYAMTDAQMAEVYALAREAFSGGQRSFQVQALPFRMTAENMARRRNDPNFAFWKNLKEGSDHFEVTKLEPKVDVCGRSYVFNADAGGTRFEPSAQCPNYQVPVSVASAVAAKQRIDNAKFAELVGSGFQLASAYMPQNGRVRRTLDQPVMVAAAEPATVAEAAPVRTAAVAAPAASAPVRVARAVPVPAPRPVALAYAARPTEESSARFGWLRGSRDEGQPEAAPSVAAAPIAATRMTPAPAVASAPAAITPTPQVVQASAAAAPASDGKPFYKRMLNVGWLGGRSEASAPQVLMPATTGSVPAPAPRPRTAYAGN
jgi:murein L,D-transpeptidase YafK